MGRRPRDLVAGGIYHVYNRAGLRRVENETYRAAIKRVDSVISGAPESAR